METVVECLLLSIVFVLIVRKIKTFLTFKKQERLDREIENDLVEEFSGSSHSDEFLNWAEELQLEHDITQRSK